MRSGAPTRLRVSNDLAVRVAVVDLQGEVVLLRDLDVRLERAVLRVAARVIRSPVEVEPGLADRPHARPRRRARRCPRGGRRGRPPSASSGVSFGCRATAASTRGSWDAMLGAPARGRQVGAHLHDASDADARGAVELLAVVERRFAVGHLEVGVVVVDRDDQGFRQRRVLPRRSCRRPREHAGSRSRRPAVHLFAGHHFDLGLGLDAREQRLERARSCCRGAACPSRPRSESAAR